MSLVVDRRAEELRARIRSCRACPLGFSRHHACPLDGPVGRAQIVLCGEAPGRNEDEQGRPFVGRAGHMLDKALIWAGTHRSEVVVLNTVCCRPPNNREPTVEEKAACWPLWREQMAMSGAWVAVALGAQAWGQVRTGGRIGEDRGQQWWLGGRLWIPTWHPAYVLRQPDKAGMLAEDINLAVHLAKSDYQPSDGVLDAIMREAVVEGFRFGKNHWAVGEMDGEKVVAVRESVVTVPAGLAGLPRYEVMELVRMGVLGAKGRMGSRMRGAVGAAKEELGGKVVGRC